MTATTPATRPARAPTDYSALLAEVKAAGLLERSATGYLPRTLALATMIAVAALAFVRLGQSWWQLVVAVFAGVVCAQIGFLGHDAGHQQIFRSRRWNDRAGLLLSNVGIGLSYGWWVDKHSRHHSHPNEVERDPDVQPNVLAWTGEQADGQRGLLRYVARHQDVLFFPLLLLEAWNLHVNSVRRVITHRPGRALEAALLALHLVASVTILLLVLPPLKALVFLLVQQSTLGLYLGCSFAPNHKGMPMLGDDGDFLRRQVLTSRNIIGGRLTHAAYGGLNYQIEHHLFPSMPSRNLRACKTHVERYCAEHGIPYAEASVLSSYAQTLRYLRSIRPTAAATEGTP